MNLDHIVSLCLAFLICEMGAAIGALTPVSLHPLLCELQQVILSLWASVSRQSGHLPYQAVVGVPQEALRTVSGAE